MVTGKWIEIDTDHIEMRAERYKEEMRVMEKEFIDIKMRPHTDIEARVMIQQRSV